MLMLVVLTCVKIVLVQSCLQGSHLQVKGSAERVQMRQEGQEFMAEPVCHTAGPWLKLHQQNHSFNRTPFRLTALQSFSGISTEAFRKDAQLARAWCVISTKRYNSSSSGCET